MWSAVGEKVRLVSPATAPVFTDFSSPSKFTATVLFKPQAAIKKD